MRMRPGAVRLAGVIVVALAASLVPVVSSAQMLQLANPHWNITLTDYGYSDFMLDNTPGFEGREYLSGEWGTAVGYQIGATVVKPRFVEPQFVFPDWVTMSTFHVVTPITSTGVNSDGLGMAQSVIANGDLEITLRHEMLDTVTGTPMGIQAASGSAAGSVHSDRYVLKQTFVVKNVSGASISNVQLFQLLHGLHSQRGVYDDRLYAGPLSEFQYDVTLIGVDPWAIGAASSSEGLEDLLSFHSSVMPSGYEIGHFGIEGNGVDAHSIGKPSDGVHLSIEDNWQTAPYDSRLGRDQFAPGKQWLAGAQRWNLGNLVPGQTASLEIVLSLLTGTRVRTGNNNSGGCNGGSGVVGGVDFEFEGVSEPGSCFGEYSHADENELAKRIQEGEFDAINFLTPGGPIQLWELDFTGTYSGDVLLTFGFDASVLPPGFDASKLCVFQFGNGGWQKLNGVVNASKHTVAVTTATLSAFVLGVANADTVVIEANALPSGGGSLSGAGIYASGSSVTLVAVPGAGYAFANWTENGSVVSASSSLTFLASSNRLLEAWFLPAGSDHAVVTSALPASGGSTAGGGVFPMVASVTIVGTANPGYKFSKWVDGEVVVSTSSSYTFEVTGNRMLVAKFKPVCEILTSCAPVEGGEISADRWFEVGEPAVLKAKPSTGYAFVNWTQNGLPVSTESNYQFTATSSRELVAHFAPGNLVKTSAEPINGGTTAGAGVFPQGSPLSVKAMANPGYVFVNWTENGVPVSTSPVYSLTSDTGHFLVANFIAQPALTLTPAGPNGIVVSWPAGAAGWILQVTADLKAPTWTDATNEVATAGEVKRVTLTPEQGQKFFRLRHQ